MKNKPNGYWTKENCIKEAKLFKVRSEFKEVFPSAYRKICTEGWLEEVFPHTVSKRELSKTKLKKYCQSEAKRFSSKKDFREQSKKAYNSASKYGWLAELCEHMTSQKTSKSYWTKERCQKEALKYSNRTDFLDGSNGAYRAAVENLWLIDICEHMKKAPVPLSSWTKDKCQTEALKHKTRKALEKACSGAYKAAKKNKWLDDICFHMASSSKPKPFTKDDWTRGLIEQEAKKFRNKTEFFRRYASARSACKENGWDLVFVHSKS